MIFKWVVNEKMTIINAAQENIAKVWGVQQPKEGERYRLMKYHLRVDHEDGVLLHNVVTGELIRLSSEETALLDALPAPYSPAMRELVEKRFLVPESYDEHKSVQQLRKILTAYGKKNEITGYTILPTTNCNARCFYCYEANYKHLNMSEETAHQTVEYIRTHCGGNKVSIGWFGGEPTIATARIDQICRELQEAGIEYSASMISNGYLLDGAMADKAKELWKLTNIQITLDGTEDIYNQVKSYVSVSGSPYQKVLENIGGLLDRDIRVSVRMNLDRHNAENLRELIDELAERFAGRENFSCYVWPLFDDCGFDPVHHSAEDADWLMEKKLKLNGYIEEHLRCSKKQEQLSFLKLNSCMADNDASVIIGPGGNLAKCEHCTEDVLGTVFDGERDAVQLAHWKETVEYAECADCPLYPSCKMLKHCFSTGRCYGGEQAEKIQNAKEAMEAACKAEQEIV